MSEKILLITFLHLLCTTLVFWLLLFISLKKKCYRAVFSTIIGLRYEKSYRCGEILLTAGILSNFFLVIFQKSFIFSPAVDLTGLFLEWEDPVTGFFLHHRHYLFDYLAAFSYFLLFPALLLLVMPILDYTGNEKAFKLYLESMGITLLIALPYFALVEVREVWMNFSPGSYFSSSEICQTFFNLRSFNFQGNCFPSIHTALTIIAVYSICKTKCPGYIILAMICGILILASILVLGIHWIIDMLGGILTSWIALKLAKKLQNIRQPS